MVGMETLRILIHNDSFSVSLILIQIFLKNWIPSLLNRWQNMVYLWKILSKNIFFVRWKLCQQAHFKKNWTLLQLKANVYYDIVFFIIIYVLANDKIIFPLSKKLICIDYSVQSWIGLFRKKWFVILLVLT